MFLTRSKFIKRTVCLVLCLFVLLPVFPRVLAEGERIGTVNVSEVNVRSAPGTWNPVVCKASLGQEVTVLGEENDSDGDMWYRVSVSGQTGYIFHKYLTVSTTPVQQERTAKVNVSEVNVRSAPGTWNPVVCKASLDQEVKVLGEENDSDGDLWYRVSVSEQTGYIFHKYLTFVQEETPTPEPTPDPTPTPEPTPEPEPSEPGETESRIGTVNDSDVNVRKGPGTEHESIGIRVSYPQMVTVLWEENGSDGYVWYYVSFSVGEAFYTGYIRSDFVTIQKTPATIDPPQENLSFEEQLAAFPEAYHAALRAIHAEHPSWNFEAFSTGLDWNVVQQNENAFRRSLINDGVLSHYSTADRCYDWKTDSFIVQEGSNWYQASPAAVAYYMDPRNFLNSNDLFQFEKLTYNNASQTEEAISGMLKGSFMEGKTTTDLSGNTVSYAKAFLDAAATHKISAFHLVTRCIQEVGWNGSSCARGNYPGYEGYYNFFNIGAHNGAEAGMAYARSAGWDTSYKAIFYGAAFIVNGYISVGQDTPYFQKYSVVDPKYYYHHQYMTNVVAALSEGRIQRREYAEMGLLETPFTFRIPFYNNMPTDPCALPAPAGSPNNLLKHLSVEGCEMTPAFDLDATLQTGVSSYRVELSQSVPFVMVSAQAVSGTATVSGHVGLVDVFEGENVLTVTCTSASGAKRDYTVLLILPTHHEHAYDNACDTTCNVCGAPRAVAGHAYDNACDAECNECGAVRAVAGHVYDNACDAECNLCGASRAVAGHAYDNACDAECNECGASRAVAGHVYDNACDGECNECGAVRAVAGHVYDNACDAECNVCGTRRIPPHVYSDPSDLICHACGYERPPYILGDVNSDGSVNSEDAIHVLYCTLFSDRYTSNQPIDFDGNGEVNSADAIYLLYHTLFGDRYPLS